MVTNSTVTVGSIEAPDFSSDLRTVPAVQERLGRAAIAIRTAIAATQAALEEADAGSDAAARCREILDALEEALDLTS